MSCYALPEVRRLEQKCPQYDNAATDKAKARKRLAHRHGLRFYNTQLEFKSVPIK